MSSHSIFVFIQIILLISIFSVNLINTQTITNIDCPKSDYYPLQILNHVTPKENTRAGVFTKISEHKSISSCVKSCCEKTLCDVVFFYNDSCYHIECHSIKSCQPTKRLGNKFAKSFMVLVRSVDHNYTPLSDYPQNAELFSDEEYNDSKQRREGRVTPSFEDYVSTLDTETPIISVKSSENACNFELNNCQTNEICKLTNPRIRTGICVCKKGYARDEQNICQPLISNRETGESIFVEESQPVVQLANGNNLTSLNSDSSEVSATHPLVVSAGPNQVIELPKDEVILSAFVLPSSTTYKYEWQLLSKPPTTEDIGNMQGSNTDHIKLSHLKAGNYSFKVIVTDKDAMGSTTVNVTVLPPRRINKPPVAVIQPANSTVQLPNKDTVLDGSYSTDDDRVVKYEWQAMTVPIGYKNLQLPSSQTLQLKDLLPGLYQLKLTVTDSDGATNSTVANVTVLKEIDYPPTANAGPDVVIHLPQNEVTLYGNQSTDDKGIIVWQWTRAPDENNGKLSAVDMDGTSTPFLHLSKLEVGVYKFVLKVTDTSNQTSKAEVHVFVKPENNEPPVANAGQNIKVVLPLDHPLVLDGSKSKDDFGINKWLWEQIDGPKQVSILNAEEPKTNLSKLIPGDYEFRLTVWDSKDLNSSATVKVNVIQAKNLPPVANAGGDKTVTLPVNEVTLNGSNSYDDVEIVSYLWQRTPESLAFGDIIENSSYTPILRLTNLITGRYLFRLTVTDAQGSTHSDVASLIVKPSQDMNDEIEMVLNSDIKTFTSDQELTVLKRLELLLNEGEPIKVQLIKLDATTHTRRVIMIFIVTKANNKRLSGREVVKQLKQKLKTDSSLINPEVIYLETFVCQNECSNHGSCDQYTKRCLCEAFWMEDMIRLYLGDKESNCDWSILYVIVISFTIVVTITAIFWTCVCCITKLRSRKPLKTRKYRKSNRNRYTLLDDDYDNDMTADKIELLTNNVKEINSQTYLSDSQSDTLFDTTHRNNLLNNKLSSNQQKRHQKSLNGLVKDYRKVRA